MRLAGNSFAWNHMRTVVEQFRRSELGVRTEEPPRKVGEKTSGAVAWAFGGVLLVVFSGSMVAQSVVRGPYLQLPTPTGIVVRWRTDVPTDSRVRYGSSPGALGSAVSDSVSTTEHVISLTGLSPETRYYYAVGSTTSVLAGGDSSYSFHTSPPPGASRPLRIWAIGDSGSGNSNAAAVRDAYLGYAGSHTADLWLMLGDNAYESGTDLEYQTALFNMFPTILRNTPLWTATGNHELFSSDPATQTGPYFDMFTLPTNGEAGGLPSGTEAYYSFDYANIHFVCLDAGLSRSATGPMLTWMASDLAANRQPWTIAYFHYPPYTKGYHDSDTEIELIEMRQNANPILEAAGVDLVLSGHSHTFERSFLIDGHYGLSTTFVPSMKVEPGSGREDDTGAYRTQFGPHPHKGVVYIQAGNAGELQTGPLDHPAMFYSVAMLGSLVIDVNGTRMDVRFVNSAGAVADYFTIERWTAFNTVVPCRVMDTRLPPGSYGGPALAAGSERAVTIAGTCGIPSTARSISANVTVTGATAAGYLAAVAGGSGPTSTSTINFPAGKTRANNATIALGPGGTLLLRAGMPSGSVNVILDVSGYYE